MKTNLRIQSGYQWLTLLIFFSFFFAPAFCQNSSNGQSVIKIGMIADIHDDEARLQAFIDKANEEKPNFIIQLGDMSSGKADPHRKMLAVWNTYSGKKYHVLGNHEFDYSTKDTIVARQEMPGTHYSFDCGDYHFIVLDCNFILKDGQYVDYSNANYYIDKKLRDLINPEQVEWLKNDIRKSDKKVIIFSHETFDDIAIRGSNPIPNRVEVRKVIDEINNSLPARNKKVIAFFAGHDHLDHYNQINGVHYFAVNSALGFMGGLEVKDSLYEFVTLDNKNQVITVKGMQSEFQKEVTDKDFKHYPKEFILPAIKDRKVSY